MTDLEGRLQAVLGRIEAAAFRSGRNPASVRLIAVTKTVPASTIAAAYALGLVHLGENRAEEAAAKVAALPPDIVWHMIGHIQSRKARRVAELFQYIHSIDSVKLALRLDRLAEPRAEQLPVLLEINVSGEGSKSGFSASRWSDDSNQRQSLLSSVREIVALPHLRVEGLMTLAPVVAHAEQARPVFAFLRRLREELLDRFPESDWHQLSMGMSDDFEVAVEEGATMVRIGRALFAPGQPGGGQGSSGPSDRSHGGFEVVSAVSNGEK